MGMPTASIAQNPSNPPMQQPQSSGGKGMAGGTPPVSTQTPMQPQAMPEINMPQSGGKGGGKGGSIQPSNMSISSTSGQPITGQPNRYPNTTGSWDNSATQQPPSMPQMAGKGKGA